MTYQDNQVSWWNKLLSYFQGYAPQWVIEGGFALIVGFFLGFIVKIFGKPLLYGLVTLIVAGYIVSYFGFADFHFEKMKAMMGITEIPALDVAFSNTIAWMKEHIGLCIGAGIGFVFGWRMGS